ncbi:hypothetical protein ACHAXT_003300 [Thalassiosira profunda]
MVCYYTLLGVGRDASLEQMRRAWKKMSLSLHPDKNEFGAELMKQVNEAYGTLSDDAKRREYDKDMRAGNGRLERKLKKLEQELKESRLEVKELKNREQTLPAELVELRKQVSLLETENHGLQLSVKELKNREETLQNDYDDARREVTLLKSQLTGKEQELHTLQSVHEELKNRVKSLMSTHKAFTAYCKQKNSKQEQEIVQLRNQVSFLETETRGLQLSLNEAQDELNDRIDMNAKEKNRARKALRKELKESQLELKESNARERSLQTSMSKVRIELMSSMERKDKELLTLQTDHEKLRTRLRAKEWECIAQQTKCTKQQQALMALRDRVHFIENESVDLQHSLNKTQNELNVWIDMHSKEKDRATKAQEAGQKLARALKAELADVKRSWLM